MNNIVHFVFLSICVLFYDCAENKKKDVVAEAPVSLHDTLSLNKTVPKKEELKITYHFTTVSDSGLKYFRKTNALKVILGINRIDDSKLHPNDTLVVPDTVLAEMKYYSPFPDSVSSLRDVKKILLFAGNIQAFAAYENGRLVRWGPTSMGKQSTPTPTGLFHTNWKARETVSTDNPEWIMKWYFNIINSQGISLHEYELPGYPASHSCARLCADDAQWIYYWAEQWKLSSDGITVLAYGTPVIIFGTYHFVEPPPWFQLTDNPSANFIPSDTLEKVILSYLAIVLERQTQRDSVIFALANH